MLVSPQSTLSTKETMDWYSWLSKTQLEQTLVYEYALVFTRNELQKEDLRHFNHEFLQSMGILIAKHRLEILKLARKEGGGTTSNGLSRQLVLAVHKAKKLLASKLTSRRASTLSDLKPYQTQWTRALKKLESSKELRQEEKAFLTSRSMMKSGPLDRGMLMAPSKNLSASGPLDGKGGSMYPIRSPMKLDKRHQDSAVYPSRCNISGPLDARGFSPRLYQEKVQPDDGVYSLWSLMFQDMKPT